MLHVMQFGARPASDGVLRAMFAARKSTLESCANAFGRKRLGHARRPPGRKERAWLSRQGSHAPAPPAWRRIRLARSDQYATHRHSGHRPAGVRWLILARWLGDEWGGLVAASVGALVSSTAVTLAFAHELRREGGIASQAGIAIASAVMLARAIILVALLAPLVAWDVMVLVGPALLLAIMAALAMAWAASVAKRAPAKVQARPPSLLTALLFASLVALVSLMAAWLEQRAGSGSGAVVIALGGMIDVDSAIATIGALPPASLPVRITALAIAAPIAFNTLLKLGMMLAIAGWNSARWAALALALPVLAIAASTTFLLS